MSCALISLSVLYSVLVLFTVYMYAYEEHQLHSIVVSGASFVAVQYTEVKRLLPYISCVGECPASDGLKHFGRLLAPFLLMILSPPFLTGNWACGRDDGVQFYHELHERRADWLCVHCVHSDGTRGTHGQRRIAPLCLQRSRQCIHL